MYKSFILFAFFTISTFHLAFSQTDRREVRKGNKLYRAEKFDEAEIKYRHSQEKNPNNHTGTFNLGNSLYKQGRYQEASQSFESIAQLLSRPKDKAQALHNLGNSYLKAEKFKESIEAYKNSLRIEPNDNETRHNLAYAMTKMQEQTSPNGKGEKDQNKDQKESQDQQDQQNQEGNKDHKKQSQQQSSQISPQDAERILNALNQKERKLQEDMNKEQKRIQTRQEKEW